MQTRTIAVFAGPASSVFEVAGRWLTLMGDTTLGQLAGALAGATCAT